MFNRTVVKNQEEYKLNTNRKLCTAKMNINIF